MVQEGELAITDGFTETVGDSLDDSLPEISYGLMLEPPAPAPQAMERSFQNGISFIFCGLFVLLLVIALRFRKNFKYAGAIFNSLVETRTRHNLFDDTVRESSILALLNLMWCVCAGIIAFSVFNFYAADIADSNLRAIGMCGWMIAALVYALLMLCAYGSVGWIFTDSLHAKMWMKGFAASQGLMTPIMFILALLAICRPYEVQGIMIVASIMFVTAKILFVWKGYKIFFSQFSSWVLFLCYLCSLEIVPLILTYRLGCLLGEEL